MMFHSHFHSGSSFPFHTSAPFQLSVPVPCDYAACSGCFLNFMKFYSSLTTRSFSCLTQS
eukprot:c39416_g1_i1 orf=56-235(+)